MDRFWTRLGATFFFTGCSRSLPRRLRRRSRWPFGGWLLRFRGGCSWFSSWRSRRSGCVSPPPERISSATMGSRSSSMKSRAVSSRSLPCRTPGRSRRLGFCSSGSSTCETSTGLPVSVVPPGLGGHGRRPDGRCLLSDRPPGDRSLLAGNARADLSLATAPEAPAGLPGGRPGMSRRAHGSGSSTSRGPWSPFGRVGGSWTTEQKYGIVPLQVAKGAQRVVPLVPVRLYRSARTVRLVPFGSCRGPAVSGLRVRFFRRSFGAHRDSDHWG